MRKTYAKPELKSFGTIKALTAGGWNAIRFDGFLSFGKDDGDGGSGGGGASN